MLKPYCCNFSPKLIEIDALFDTCYIFSSRVFYLERESKASSSTFAQEKSWHYRQSFLTELSKGNLAEKVQQNPRTSLPVKLCNRSLIQVSQLNLSRRTFCTAHYI